MSALTISVVVIGRNEGERLTRCLESVATMVHPGGGVEVIYVDSASTDGSPQRAAALGARVLEVRPPRPCAAVGRNAGWRAASAPTVLFLDGDTRLAPDFVTGSLSEFNDPKVAVVWGHRRELAPRASIFNRVLDLDWIYPPGVSEFCGGDALIRRQVLEEIGGFDERLIAGEEPEMYQRIRARGYTILHVDRPMTGHDLAMSRWSQYWRRALRAGYAYAEVSDRFAAAGIELWQAEARRNRIHGTLMLALVAIGLAGSLLARSLVPIALAAAIVVLLALRTAHRVRWKSPDFSTRLLYGLHSHLQQITILFGQIRYRRDRRAGRIGSLIEYKSARPAGGEPLSRGDTA
ncbi:MAG TPA: glycosyltransferase [Candidatus Binataceae bacterium]|jgi:glycosyltransferase involved in cell wall biosynthesis|nr:glycosyltransferase [Candidatus Binataceae bacterium]